MASRKDTYHIVLLGGMNPRIHHPSWYRYINLFDEEETEASLKTPNTFVASPLAQIRSPKVTIACQDDRWEINTHDVNQLQRIKDLTASLFDDILPHTPVIAAGFNFNFSRPTAANDVGSFLASTLVHAPLGLARENSVSGEVTLRRGFDDHTVMVNVLPVKEEKGNVFVSHNYEYRFTTQGPFKLGKVIAERYDIDRNDAEEQTRLIIEAMDRLSRK